jgi:large subunit ribosomal protein L13
MVNKTKMKKKEEVVHEWFIMDASDKVLGRAATRIATLIKGKHRPDFTPHVDSGAGVIVLNCDKIRVTGKKSEQKFYTSYSGYPSGLKKVRYDKMHVKNPKYILRHAVKGMLPHNKLGDRMIRRLKLYTGDKHPHSAQNPQEIKL